MEDITKTGPVGLKGLSYNESPSPEEGYKEAYSQIMNAFSSKSDIMPQDFMSGTRNVGSELLQYGVGNSKFDEGIFYSQIENIGDYRANQQSGLGQVANGLAKGVVLAGTTFLDGIVGAIIGGAKAIEEGRWSALWDNEFSKDMKDLNDAMEKALPNYYTNYDQEHPWENIFSANFLGDKFIKNLGFAVGAFYSGGLYAGGVKAVGKGAMKVAKGLGATTKTIKGISNATGIAASALGVVSSAVNEGRIEALNNSTDWYKYQKAIIDDTYSQRLNSLKSFEGTFMYESMLAKEQEAYDATIAKLNEDRLKMGNADLLMNLPILMASNTIQFAKLYSKGYRTAKKNFNILGSPGKYTAGTTKASAAWGITKGALSEGTEEISQRAASDISGNYYATDVNNFYKAAIDPEAEQETLSWIKSFASGINSTVNDDSAWEEFLIGSLTGFLGIPTFRSTRSKEGKIQLPIQLQGGAFNEWKEYKELAAREKELVKQLNDRINSPEYLNYYQGLIRHNGYQRLMDSAIERGDEFNFKNAEHAQLVSDIIMFDEAGKLEDLKTAIEEAASMSEDDLKALVVNTTAVDSNGNLIGPYAEYAVKDENGNISAVFGSSNSIKDIQNSLRNNRDTILKSIDKYQKTKDNLLFEVGDKFSPKQIEELTWMKTQIENWEERSKSTAALVSSEIDDTIENLKLRTQTFSSDTESIPSLEEKRILNQISVLEKLRSFKPENLAHILYNNIDVYKLLLDITQNTEGIVREAGKQNFVTNLADLLSMADAINTYVSKLEEYLKNPEKLTEDNNIAHAEQEAEAKRTTIVNATNRVNNSKVSDLVRESDSGNIDLDSIDALFEESEEDVTEAKAKIEEVRGINNAHRRLASAGSILDKLAGEDPEKQKAARDAKTLLNNSKAKADSVEEFLDVDREAFLDPSVLYDEELYAELSEDNEAIQSALNDALDSARSLIQQAKQILDDENISLSDIPTAQEGIVERVMGTTGHDATTSTVSVNSTNASDAEVSPYVFATPSVSPDKFSSQKEDTEKAGNKFFSDLGNYWKPSMSQFPIHRIAGDDRPFHQILRDSNYTYLYSRGNNIFETIVYSKEEVDKIEKVYNYLLDRGAFSIVDSGQIQPGEKITFFTDKTLNEQVGEVVILIKDSKGRVIGNLVSENSKIRDSQASLKAFRDEFMEQYEAYNATNDTEDTTFEYGESTVAKNMVGKPQYTAKNDRLPLNRIFPNGFKLGIAMTSGRNANIVVSPGRKKAQGQTKFERAILSPLDAVSGQPFVLLPTSRKQNGEVVNITIPFLMPSFNNETRNSLLGKEIENIIESFSSIKTDAQAAAAKFELQELLAISDLHINIVNGELIVSLIAPGETKQTTIYKGNPTSPNMVSSIINGLVAMNIPFQISRKYINTTYNNRDYNAMIGELAETNLPANTTNTVNEWFTINPISKGKEIKAKSPKTTGLNPNRAMPSYQEISIGNMQFTINSKTNEVLDSEGQPYNGKYANHVKAKAHAIKINAKPDSVVKTDWGYYDLKIDDFVTLEDELENLTNGKIERTLETTDTPKTYSKERIKELLSKRGVRRLAASYLSNELNTKNTPFEGKTIEDFDSALDSVSAMLSILIAKKATIDEIKNRLANSNSWQLLQVGSLRVGANLEDILKEYGYTVNESAQESKPKSKTPSKSLISTKESKAVWEALTPEQQDTLLSMSPAKQKAMMEHLKAAYSIGADLESVINVVSGTKHREATLEAYQPWNEERELKWLSRALPSLSSDERIRVVNGINGLIPIGDTGRFAYGRFRNGIIEIGRNAARGTVYHEAFHAVTHTLLSDKEVNTLFEEARKKYGNLKNDELEEKLAEDFRRYVQIGESGFSGVVNKIFRTLKHLWQKLRGNEPYIDNLFYRINRGKLANISYKSSPNIDKTRSYTEEELSILEKAPRNAEGQLLAPNGKPTKLSERQYAQVRTKAFKEWFGDWELFANIPEDLLQQVSLIYERNPELAKIGTPIEYAAYLQSIFPNSKDKSIYWHGSDSDFSQGFNSAVKGKGSGSPHITGEFYLAKQAWTVLQYVSGVNRIFGPDINGFNHWNKLWWELKEIMSNGRRYNNDWKDLIIGPENVRQGIPNKRGVFNRDSGGTNGKWLKERKADYGYQDKSDEEFFRDVFGIEYGKDTFNTWTQRNAEIFKSLEKTVKGIYPAIINATNPIRESGQNTYYEPERGLLTQARLNKNDAILGSNTDNEFNSDVAVIFNPEHNIHFLGTKQDVEAFKLWLQTNRASKVIDSETGEPKVVYHGSPNTTFTVFDKEKIGSNTDEGFYGRGFYFSEDKGISNKYGKEREFFLNIKNPYEINPDKIGWRESNRRAYIVPNFNAKDPTPYDSELSKYDGVLQTLMENGEVLYMAEIVIPNANQIKSAIDNVGTFSRYNNDIIYREAEVSWYEEHIEAEKERLQKTIKALKTAPSINSTISFSDGTFKRYDSVEYLTERDARSVINKEMSPEFREAYDVREKTGRYHIIKRPQKTIKEKIDEVRRLTERTIREYERAIVEIENIRNIEASREALEAQEVYYREVKQYHMSKYDLGKLSEEDKAYIRSRGISIEEYINMSYFEKDALFRCM